MHPTFQLLERHLKELETNTIHWFDCPENSYLIKTTDKQFNLEWSAHNSAQLTDQSWPTAKLNILFYPKAKDRLQWWINKIVSQLKSDQQLWVVGENNCGIKSLSNKLGKTFECHKIDSARHCALFDVLPGSTNPEPEQWHEYSYNQQTMYTLPGVFSAKSLDKGTEILINALPQLKGHILEFGGGCGVLTSVLAQQKRVTFVKAVEIDLLAVRSSLKTLETNNLKDKANTLWSEGTSELAAEKFDAIVTNPPFHKGVKTVYAPTEAFFHKAHLWLKPSGKLIWVANEFLDYHSAIQSEFTNVEVLVHRNGFKVYQAIRK